LIPIPNG